MQSKWKMIEESKCDILLTHCPPYCHGDKVADENASRGLGDPYTGSPKLLDTVINCGEFLKYHVFGHIHGGYGVSKQKNCSTWFVNAATCDEGYRPFHKPVLFYVLRPNDCVNICIK